MSILGFLWELRFPLCILFAVVLFFLFVISSRLFGNFFFKKVPYIISLAIIVFGSIFCIDKFYINPSNLLKTFSNANVNLIEHYGFAFSNDSVQLKLANRAIEKSDENEVISKDALFDEIYGKASINAQGILKIEKPLSEPLFVKSKNESTFQLLNNYTPLSIGEKFSLIADKDTLFTITKKEGRKKYSLTIFENGKPNKNDDITLNLKWGIEFNKLLNGLSSAASDEFQKLMSGSYILRNNVNRDLAGNEFLFFPGSNLQNRPKLSCSDSGNNYPLKFNIFLKKQVEDGSTFYFGLGDNPDNYKLSFNKNTKGFSLDLQTPIRHPLKSEPNQQSNLFVTSNYNIAAENTSLTGGYLFPWFQTKDHELNIDANIFYKTGNSNDTLDIRITTQAGVVEPNKGFYYIPVAQKSGIEWKFKFEDLKAKSPIKTAYIYLFGVAFLCLVSMIVFVESWSKKKTVSFISPIEAVVYPVFFLVILFRILLQWRLTVFPELGTYSLSQNNYFKFTVIYSLVFLLIRLLIALLQKRESNPFEVAYERIYNFYKDENDAFFKFLIYTGVHACLIVGIILVASFGGKLFESLGRMVNIYVPVLLFLFFSYLFSDTQIIKSKREKTFYNYLFNPYRITNSLITLLGLGLLDGGYANLFLLLLIFYIPFGVYPNVESSKKWLSVVVSGLVFIALIKGGNIMLFLFHNPWVLIIGGLLFVAFCVFVILQHFEVEYKSITPKKAAVLAFAFLFVASYLGSLNGFIESKAYALARLAVVTTPLSQLIEQASYKENYSTNDASGLPLSRILNAAENRSLISVYYDSNKLSIDPTEKNKYFRLKDHYQTGAFLAFQISDLSVVRFIIAEHSEWMVFLILLLFALIPLYIFYFTKGIPQSKQRLALRASLLIFCSGLFVWLTSTNRYVFFGQDFPLISLNSKLTLLLTCSLLLIVILFTKDAKNKYPKLESYTPYFAYACIPVVLLTLMGFLGGSGMYEKDVNSYKTSLSSTVKLVEEFNSKLTRLQTQNDTINGKAFLDMTVNERIANCEFEFENENYKPFAKSAFKYYNALQNKQDPREIIFAVQTGEKEAGSSRKPIYELQVNKTHRYTPSPSFMKSQWNGHILSANSSKSVSLKGASKTKLDDINPNKFKRIDWDGAKSNTDEKIVLRSIPQSWILNADKAILLVSTYDDGAAKSFTLTNFRSEFETKNSDEHSITLGMIADDDILKIYDGKSEIDQLKLVENYNEYVMKNMWINGRQRSFYPLGGELLWAYQFSKSVESAWSNNIQQVDKNLKLTLDVGLSEKINTLYNKYNHFYPSHFGLTIIDNKGRIRVIEDHDNTWGAQAAFDPNDENDIRKYNNFRQTKRNISDERKELGNINLMTLQRGPGSTLKPLVAAAIISKYKMDWNRLNLFSKDCEPTIFNEKGELVEFGNRAIYPWYKDEGNMSFSDYIINSRNQYHSLMVFLGSYTAEKLNNIKNTLQTGSLNNESILTTANGNECSYPAFALSEGAENRYTFKKDKWPSSTESENKTFFGNKNSIIAKGLETNLGLATSKSELNQAVNFYQSERSILENEGYATAYSFPEQSHFYQSNRSESSKFGKGLRNSSLGGDPWRMSPIKVAQMAAALFGNNRQLELTIDHNFQAPKAAPFEVGGWNDAAELYDFYKKYLFADMKNVLTSGTAAGGFAGVNNFSNGVYTAQDGNKYYLYGKTGTTNSVGNTGNSDKFFLLVVSKNDLTKLPADQFDENPFVVLMFTCLECVQRSGNGYSAILRDLYGNGVLNELTKSSSFKQTMQGR